MFTVENQDFLQSTPADTENGCPSTVSLNTSAPKAEEKRLPPLLEPLPPARRALSVAVERARTMLSSDRSARDFTVPSFVTVA